jgi:predicted enzyme related to lactoylglutathione lyase
MANHHGDFIWYELMSSDAKASETFYGPLLGWRFGGGDDYREIAATEGGVGGVLQLTPDMIAGGARPAWLGYILVHDVDKMVTSIEQGGGRVFRPALTMDGVGRFAMVADPQGAPFYVIKPTPPPGQPEMESHAFSYDRPRLGHCAWNELATDDPVAARHFYATRFGWVKDGEMDMGPLGTYEFLRHAERAPEGSQTGRGMLGAVMKLMPGQPAPAWTFYFRVSDVDVAVAHVTSRGGRILQPPTEIPGGEFALIAVDPQGAAFGLVGGRKRR